MTNEEAYAYVRQALPLDRESLCRMFNFDPDHEYTEEEWESLDGKPDFVPDDRYRGMHPCLRPLTSAEDWRELLRPMNLNRLDGDPAAMESPADPR